MKLAIVGGPSTRKTTLVKRVARILRKRRYKVAIVDDPARIYIKKWILGKREMVIADQLWILRDWIEKEISLAIRAFLDTYLWQDPRWHIIRGDLKERANKVLEIILKPC